MARERIGGFNLGKRREELLASYDQEEPYMPGGYETPYDGEEPYMPQGYDDGYRSPITTSAGPRRSRTIPAGSRGTCCGTWTSTTG